MFIQGNYSDRFVIGNLVLCIAFLDECIVIVHLKLRAVRA